MPRNRQSLAQIVHILATHRIAGVRWVIPARLDCAAEIRTEKPIRLTARVAACNNERACTATNQKQGIE
jgi:hypothetical protein